MTDEAKSKEKAFEFPMMPIFGVDLGRELGSIDSRLIRVENDILKLDAKIEKLDSKIDAVDDKLTAMIGAVDSRVDKCLVSINRLDERTRNLESNFRLSIGLSGGILIAVLAGIVLQFFFK